MYLKRISHLADPGELSVIALAEEIPNSLLILDDDKTRKLAHAYGLRFTGTLRVLVRAKVVGNVSLVGPIIDKIRQTNFRISELLYTIILTSVGK